MRKSFFATTLIAALASLASNHTCQAVDLEELYKPDMLAETLASVSAQPESLTDTQMTGKNGEKKPNQKKPPQ